MHIYSVYGLKEYSTVMMNDKKEIVQLHGEMI